MILSSIHRKVHGGQFSRTSYTKFKREKSSQKGFLVHPKVLQWLKVKRKESLPRRCSWHPTLLWFQQVHLLVTYSMYSVSWPFFILRKEKLKVFIVPVHLYQSSCFICKQPDHSRNQLLRTQNICHINLWTTTIRGIKQRIA